GPGRRGRRAGQGAGAPTSNREQQVPPGSEPLHQTRRRQSHLGTHGREGQPGWTNPPDHPCSSGEDLLVACRSWSPDRHMHIVNEQQLSNQGLRRTTTDGATRGAPTTHPLNVVASRATGWPNTSGQSS